MYCCACGSTCPENAACCPQCGSAQLPEPNLSPESNHSLRTQVSTDNEAAIIQRLRSSDVKSYECHGCGNKQELLSYPFALAKTLNVERNWAGTAASIAVSAVSIPLTGFGVFQIPRKRTRYRMIRMTLILCPKCRKHTVTYERHPWWNVVYRLGYTEFLDRYDLEELRS